MGTMKRFDYGIYIILLPALILRLYFAITCKAIPDYSDMALYNELAMSGGFPSSLPFIYPLFLRLVYSIFGAYNYKAVFIIQAILSTFTVYLVYYVATKLKDKKAGLISASIAAIYPGFITYNLTTMTEAITLVLTMLLLASLVIETDDRRKSIAAAAVLSIGFCLRPSIMFFMPGVLPLVKKRWLFLITIVVLLSPWFIYRGIVEGDNNRGARLFYKSYNERSDGISNYKLIESPLRRDDLPSKIYIEEALDYIWNNKWQTVNILYNKVALILCRGYDQHVLKEIVGKNKYILYMIYYFHIPLFMLGLIMMIRFYDRSLNILIFPAASYLLVTILFAFFKFRYRLPAEPMFVIATGMLIAKFADSNPLGRIRSKPEKKIKKRKKKKPPRKQPTQNKKARPGLSIRELFLQIRDGIVANWKFLAALLVISIVPRILFAVKFGVTPVRHETLRLLALAEKGGFGPGDPPLYPLFMRSVFTLFGGTNPNALYIVQGIIGAATLYLLYAVMNRICSHRVAIITAGIAAVYPSFLIYGVTIDPGFLGIFMFVLMTAVIVSDLREPHKSIAAAIATGLAIMIQPYLLLILPGVLLVIEKRRVFLLAVVAMLIPLTIRNSIVYGSFLPVFHPSVFDLGIGNFAGLEDRLMFVDNLYHNGSILISRGWDKQKKVDFAGIIYTARYAYVLLMAMGLAGLIRHYSSSQRKLLLPVVGYFLMLIVFSTFRFQQRLIIEPVLIAYTGILLAGGCRLNPCKEEIR